MPWVAVPFDKTKNQELFTYYNVTSNPLLILIDRKGDIKSTRLKEDILIKGSAAFEDMKYQHPSPTKELV